MLDRAHDFCLEGCEFKSMKQPPAANAEAHRSRVVPWRKKNPQEKWFKPGLSMMSKDE